MPMRIYVYKYHQILYLSSSRCKRDRKWMGTSEACGHHFHRHCLEKALAAGTRGCPLCRRTLRSPEGGPVGGGLGDLGGSVVEPSAENWGAHGSPAKNGDFMWKAGDLWWVNIGRTRKKSGEIHQLKGYNTSTEILLHACLQCGWTTSEKPSMILRHVRLVLQNDHATSCPDLGILKSTWKVCVAGWWFQTYFYFPEYMG